MEHLQCAGAPPNTPLHTVYLDGGGTKHVTATDLTNTLRSSCKVIGEALGIKCSDISARALRAGGAMALLRARVDPTNIRLLGRWKSWELLTYLHRSATNTTNYAAQMLEHGRFHVTTHAFLPADVLSFVQPVLE